jgi:RNA polymerase sigma-70 factor (ECF subfamily)
MPESESAAVARAREGDAEAYRMLVEQHSRSLFRLAFRMTGNEHDAEDIVQETLLRAHRQLARYESRSSFSTWLYRIAANCSLDLIRARKRRGLAQERDVDEETANSLARVPAPEPSPERLAYGSEMQQKVAQAMNQLSSQERTAFVLRHFEGHSIGEIGSALGLSENATKHSIFRAVRKLRQSLEAVVGSVTCST